MMKSSSMALPTITKWTGCYDGGWTGIISSASYQHPAKFAKGLIERIYDHCLHRGAPTMTNLALEFAESRGGLAATRSEYDDACIDFAGDLVDHVGRGRIVYFENPIHTKWRYHASAEIDGFVHDLWLPGVIPTAQFAILIGAVSYDYPAEEKV